jgi:aminoglycoside 3-N-acetyltransferase
VTGGTVRQAPPEAAQSRASLAADLRALGIRPGQVLLVHASARRIGPIRGGAAAVVAALRDVIGPAGTLVVPAMTAENSDTSRTHLARIEGKTPSQIAAYREMMPPFDPATSPSTGMGCIAEYVRTMPGAVRSGHPQSSFAALGLVAGMLMDGHRADCHFGESSPLARLYEADASILLLGVGYAVCSAFHLAEYRYATEPPLRSYRCVVARDGAPMWWQYRDVVLDDGDFEDIGADLDRGGIVARGRIGHADSRLIRFAHAVDFATEWLARHRALRGVTSPG